MRGRGRTELIDVATRFGAPWPALFASALPAGVSAQPVPSVVEEVKTVTADENRAAFLIRFSPAEPQTAAINNNPTRPELLLRSTLRAPRVPPQGQLSRAGPGDDVRNHRQRPPLAVRHRCPGAGQRSARG